MGKKHKVSAIKPNNILPYNECRSRVKGIFSTRVSLGIQRGSPGRIRSQRGALMDVHGKYFADKGGSCCHRVGEERRGIRSEVVIQKRD